MIAFSLICMSCGNREGISSLPYAHPLSVDLQCSIELLFIFIVMSFGITHLTFVMAIIIARLLL